MGLISYTVPAAGTDSNATADPEIATALTTLLTLVNGNLDTNNLSGSAAITVAQLAVATQQAFLQTFGGIAAKVQYGHLGAVTSDGGGWCNYSLPNAYAHQIDFIIAVNAWGANAPATSGNGTAFAVVQPSPVGSAQFFRAFNGVAGVSVDCFYLAIGH